MPIINGLAVLMQDLLQLYLNFAGPLVSLALLSLSVFLVMLPLYKLGDVLIAHQRQSMSAMQLELNSIVEVPSSKRYFYTREIYRRYGYSPLQALISLFGLFVQLPFFIAAYRMLHDFSAFSGLSAGPFADLSKPDALLQFSGIDLNVIPVVMTLLNLLSAYYYARSPQEKKKIWLFPSLFLVLLYDQPTALVFYWTMNNVFSLLKNLYLSKKRSGSLKIPELCHVRRYYRNSSALHFSLCFVALFFGFLYFLYTDSDKEIPSLWVNFSIALFLYLICFYSLGFDSSGRNKFKIFRSILKSTLALMIFSLLVLEIYSISIEPLEQLIRLRRQIQILRPIILFFELFCLCFLLLPHLRKPKKNPKRGLSEQVNEQDFKRYALAVAISFMAMFWTVPLKVLASDPASFESNTSYLHLGLYLLLFVIVPVLVLYGLYFVLPTFLRRYASILGVVAACFFSINVLLFPGNYGHMEFTSFKKTLQISNNEIFFSALLLTILLVLVLSLYRHPHRPKSIMSVDSSVALLLGVHLLFIFISLYRIGHYHWQLSRQDLTSSHVLGTNSAEETFKIGLSPNEKNVAIIMLDKFMGGMLPLILQANPDLTERLSGFIYYPNTVSQANQTYGGFHPMLGGSEYTVDQINQSEQSVSSSIIEAFTLIPKALKEKGFSSYFVNVHYLVVPRARGAMQQRLKEEGVQELQTSLDYSLLPDPSVVQRDAKLKWQNFLGMIGVFQAFGPIFRDKIYDDGRWLNMLGNNNLWASIAFWEPYIELLSLPRIIQAQEDANAAYMLMHNHLPHNTGFSGAEDYYSNPKNFSFRIPEIPSILQERDRKNGNRELATMFLACYESLVVLADWFDDLKAKGLYENTLIYVTSDHGARFFDPSFQEQNKGGLRNKANFHSLYMRKDIAAVGRLQIDQEFRTMGDIPAEFLPQFGVDENPYTGKKLEPVRVEPIPLYFVGGMAKNEGLGSNNRQIYTYGQYNLHNRNIFIAENWEAISLR